MKAQELKPYDNFLGFDFKFHFPESKHFVTCLVTGISLKIEIWERKISSLPIWGQIKCKFCKYFFKQFLVMNCKLCQNNYLTVLFLQAFRRQLTVETTGEGEGEDVGLIVVSSHLGCSTL